MTWTTKTEYVDRHSGEILRKTHIEKNIYNKIKCTIKHEKHSEWSGTKHIRWECELNGQTKLF